MSVSVSASFVVNDACHVLCLDAMCVVYIWTTFLSCPKLFYPVVDYLSSLSPLILSISPYLLHHHTVILADSIRNYMSKFLSDAWMYENGFVDEKVLHVPVFSSTLSRLLPLFVPTCLHLIVTPSLSPFSVSFYSSHH